MSQEFIIAMNFNPKSSTEHWLWGLLCDVRMQRDQQCKELIAAMKRVKQLENELAEYRGRNEEDEDELANYSRARK